MTELWESFEAIEKFYFFCAAGGGVLFLFFMALAFLGGLDHADAGGDVGHGGDVHVGDADVDAGGGDVHVDGHAGHDMVDPGFKALSIQGISSFTTMFGVVGLAISRGGQPVVVSWLGATGAGFAMLYAMKQIWTLFLRLQSSGTIKMQNAVGKEGQVYLRIPADGTGKAEVTVQDRLQIFDAVSERKEELPTGTPIRVVRIIGGEVLAVEKR